MPGGQCMLAVLCQCHEVGLCHSSMSSPVGWCVKVYVNAWRSVCHSSKLTPGDWYVTGLSQHQVVGMSQPYVNAKRTVCQQLYILYQCQEVGMLQLYVIYKRLVCESLLQCRVAEVSMSQLCVNARRSACVFHSPMSILGVRYVIALGQS